MTLNGHLLSCAAVRVASQLTLLSVWQDLSSGLAEPPVTRISPAQELGAQPPIARVCLRFARPSVKRQKEELSLILYVPAPGKLTWDSTGLR